MLVIKDLHAGYSGVEILRGINLSLTKGEIVAVLGSNGVGKSTLNNNISALYMPYKGSIIFEGEEILGMSSMQVVDRGLIHVPEGRKIFPNLNVKENLEMGSLRRGKKNRVKNLEKVFSVFPRLKERIYQSAGTMSGGEQQMLAIGRGIMSDPLLLILDEPSLGLSPLMVKEMFLLISQLNQEGQSILIMEQNAVQALAISRRAYLIENGLITMSGDSSQMAADPDLKKRYLGL
jgi:branched-chain amino acid transport system ATP-binding protein